MDGKIRVIIKRPDERYGHVTNISNTLKNLQRTVEGYIETVTLGDIVIICNEEGRLLGLEPHVFRYRGETFVFCGTIIFAGVDGDEFADVPISFREYKERFFEEV